MAREPPLKVGRITEPEPSQDVAEPQVLHKRSVRQPARKAFVVDHQRLVLLLDSTTLQRAVAREVVPGSRALDVLRERLALQLDLPLPLCTRAERKVQHLDRMPRAQRDERLPIRS